MGSYVTGLHIMTPLLYKCPYKTHITQYFFEVIKITYTRIGMLCKCTTHRGIFELVGPRVICQAGGSIYCVSVNSVNNVFFNMDMESKLLLQVKSLTNSLHK